MRRPPRFLSAVFASSLLAACAAERIRSDADALMRRGDYEQALAQYDEGLKRYPEDVPLRASAARARTAAAEKLTAAVGPLQAKGRFDEADALIQRALALDPRNDRALALKVEVENARRTRAAVEHAEELCKQGRWDGARRLVAAALRDSPRSPELNALLRRIDHEQQRDADEQGAKLTETRPISLQFREANLKMVLEALSRSAGVNFVLDRDIRPDARATIFLRDAKLEDALDLLTSTNQLGKKVLDATTVLIYPNTPEKLKEYQDLVMRAFYLRSADAKQTAALLKTMLKLHEVFVDDKLNLIVIREPADTVRLAERLVALHDLDEPEVVMEVEVLEVGRNRLLQLGIDYPSSLTLTPLSTAGLPASTVRDLRGLNQSRIGINAPTATLNAHREVDGANLLANPRIRAKNREKAKILIGDRVPIITSTATSTGFVSENVQYLDVGLKLEVEPQISIDDDVAIKVSLEVSSLANQIRTASGSLAYQIGTRNASTTLRLRDGETQLLAGLINAEERSSSSRVPGLGDLPLLGRLFSSNQDSNNRTEIVLSITPRLVRSSVRPDLSQAEFASGTETNMRLRPRFTRRPALEDGSVKVTSGAVVDAPSPPAVSPAEPVSSASSSPQQDAPAGGPKLTIEAPTSVAVGGTFPVVLTLTSSQPLRGMPVQLRFDAKRLELVSVEEGAFFKQGGAASSFSQHVPPGEGRLLAAQMRAGTEGTGGRAELLRVTFKAKVAGDAEIAIDGASAIGVSGAVPAVEVPPITRIQIK